MAVHDPSKTPKNQNGDSFLEERRVILSYINKHKSLRRSTVYIVHCHVKLYTK
jgi:hypothetical protein